MGRFNVELNTSTYLGGESENLSKTTITTTTQGNKQLEFNMIHVEVCYTYFSVPLSYSQRFVSLVLF